MVFVHLLQPDVHKTQVIDLIYELILFARVGFVLKSLWSASETKWLF